MRSAISHHYRERGYRVLLSEKADFSQAGKSHSYHACLDAIRSSEIFILLIGNRRGGWFDEKSRVSITQQEYRIAHALSVDGHLKMASFVRKQVWDARNTIKRVRSSHPEVGDSVCETIAKSFGDMQDYRHAIGFVDEVAKVEETKRAVSGKSSFPMNNWIVPFSSFSEVIEGVSAVMGTSSSVREISRKKAIEEELCGLLRHFYRTTKEDRRPSPIYDLMPAKFMDRQYKNREFFTVDRDDLVALSVYSIYATGSGSKGSFSATESAIKDAAFCDFDYATGLIKETELHKTLCEIVDRFRQRFMNLSDSLNSEHSKILAMKDLRQVNIEIFDIIFTVAHARSVKGMERLLIRALVLLKNFRPSDWLYEKVLWSPLHGVDDGVEFERPTLDEMKKIISDGIRHE